MIKKRGLGTNRGLDALLGNIAIEKKIIADAQEAVADQQSPTQTIQTAVPSESNESDQADKTDAKADAKSELNKKSIKADKKKKTKKPQRLTKAVWIKLQQAARKWH